MKLRQKWDALSIAAVILCAAPEVVTHTELPLPTDLLWWEWVTVMPMAALLLGTPQLAMLGFVKLARWQALRLLCLMASVGMLGPYYYYLTTTDLMISSTAVVGLFFVQFEMAIASGVVAGLLLLGHTVFLRRRNPS
jgi:hypothetical protein